MSPKQEGGGSNYMLPRSIDAVDMQEEGHRLNRGKYLFLFHRCLMDDDGGVT